MRVNIFARALDETPSRVLEFPDNDAFIGWLQEQPGTVAFDLPDGVTV